MSIICSFILGDSQLSSAIGWLHCPSVRQDSPMYSPLLVVNSSVLPSGRTLNSFSSAIGWLLCLSLQQTLHSFSSAIGRLLCPSVRQNSPFILLCYWLTPLSFRPAGLSNNSPLLLVDSSVLPSGRTLHSFSSTFGWVLYPSDQYFIVLNGTL